MKMRTKRLLMWVISMLFALVYIGVDNYKEEEARSKQDNQEEKVKKESLYMYQNIADKDIVKECFGKSDLNSKYELVFNSKDSKNELFDSYITNSSSVMNDGDITSIAISPLVIGMKNSDSNFEKYQKNKLISLSTDSSDHSEITIDFAKIVEAVIEGENWSKFGGTEKEIQVYIPAKDTLERKFFYNMLLLTLNDGTFPTNDEKIVEVENKAESFLNSKNVIETDVISELQKFSQINETDIYIFFEADFMNSSVWKSHQLDIALAYPENTLVRHVYTKSEVEREALDEFYKDLVEELHYRTSSNSSPKYKEKDYNINDNFNFVEISESNMIKEHKWSFGVVVICTLIILLGILFVIAVYTY